MSSWTRGPLRAITLLILATSAGCFGPGDASLERPDGFPLPALAAAPVLDRLIGPKEWEGAATLNSSFVIADGTLASGTYPFTAWLGYNTTMLLLAVKVDNTSVNPWTVTERGKESWRGDSLSVLIAPEGAPLDDHGMTVFSLNFREFGTRTVTSHWNGSDWIVDNFPRPGVASRTGFAADNLVWEITIPRWPPDAAAPGPRLDEGTPFRLGLVFERQGAQSPDGTWGFGGPHDAFPGDGYTPRNPYDPSTWLRAQLGS